MKSRHFACLFLICCALVSAAHARQISYTITPMEKGRHDSFLVEMSFTGNATGKTLLTVPFEQGRYRPQDFVSITEVANSNNHRRVAEDSSLYLVEHTPNARLRVKYLVKNALQDSLPTIQETDAQMLTHKYFYLIGNNLWIVPNDNTQAQYELQLHWKGFPANWTYLNSFGAAQAKQRITASLNDFSNAIYMGGDLRLLHFKVNGKPVILGMRGRWSFTDEALAEIVKKTVHAQRTYWNDYEVERYTVGLIPMKYALEEERSIYGRGLTNTFISIGTNSKAFTLDDLIFLYNHEFMHHWLGHVLKQAEPETAFKWFHEGFTDYFAHAAMLDGGLLNEEQFKSRINTIFASYYKDSTHQWSNEHLQNNYWASFEMQKLPYQRGLIFALYLDEAIRKHSNNSSSLKQVIQQLLWVARQQSAVFSQERLLALLQQQSGHDFGPELNSFITEGAFIAISDWTAVTDKISMLPSEVYDPGFTTDMGKIALNARITSIREGSDAQRAGLQAGDILLGFSSNMQPTSLASIVVMRGEEKIKLQYLPNRTLSIPQLK